MKTASLPPIGAAPDLHAFRTTVAEGTIQADFVKRGIAAIETTKHNGGGIPAEVVIAKLQAKLAAARQAKAQRGA